MLNTQAEREALVNLMLLVRFSDKKLSLSELETFENIVMSMDWTDVISEDSHISEATESVRYSLQTEALTDSFIKNNCAVFSDDVKDTVISKLTSVMMVDGQHEAEKVMVDKIKVALGV